MLAGFFIQVLLLDALFSSLHVSAQVLTSSLPENQPACPDQRVTFTCEIQASSLGGLALAWESDDFIGSGGAQILFGASTDSPGRRQPSAINQDTVAEYTALRNESDGSLRLISVLNVTVSSNLVNPSVSCIDIGTSFSTMRQFTILGDPEMPQNVTANQRIDNTGNCFLLMNWNPPLNLDKEDISCYQVYVNDTNNFKENLTLTAYPVHTCGSHTIRVTAFNRCDRMSPNSSTITVDQDPSPLQSIFLTTQSTTPESESPSGISTRTLIIASAVPSAVALLFIIITIILVVVLICIISCRDNDQSDEVHGTLK